MAWIYHGKDRRQCYYRPNCIVCYVRLFVDLLRLWARLRREAKG